MASSGASISLGSNFYVSPKTGGVSVMQTRKGAVSSQVKLTFTVLTGVLRIVARHLDKVMGRLDFDDHVPLSDEYHLAVVGSTFDGEETRVGANPPSPLLRWSVSFQSRTPWPSAAGNFPTPKDLSAGPGRA